MRTVRVVLGLDCDIVAEQHNDRYVVRPANASQRLPLRVGGEEAASLKVHLRLQLDHVGRYLAVEQSDFVLLWGEVGDPLLRVHYNRPPRLTPAAHWHVHAERGAFAALLAQSGRRNPHSLAGLHLPVGGSRMRPCLEDFLQFLIDDVGIDAEPGAQEALAQGREVWRRKQIAALVRDVPEEAVRVLEEHGYSVHPPPAGPRPTKTRHLHQY